MKKTFVAAAVLGAMASTAFAADVTLYGLVDLGLNYTQTKTSGFADATKNVTNDSFAMGSGQNSGSRFGLKGTEDLGNGYKVGFVLENGFKADTGAFEKGGRLFHREALLFVQSPFGELSMGRTGALDAGTGRYNMLGSGASAMGTGMDAVGNSDFILMGTKSRMDNTITYQSPSFAGVTVLAQASLKNDGTKADVAATDTTPAKTYTEGSSDADRYYGLGVKFNAGALNAGIVGSVSDYSRYDVTAVDEDNGYAVAGYVNYDFGMIKPMFAVQYWNGGAESSTKGAFKDTEGYGLVIGATAPVLGGTVKATAGWNDFEDVKDTDTDYNNWMVGVSYEYSLSKRTSVYTAAGYKEAQAKKTATTEKTKTTEVMVGLVHKF